LIVTPNLVSEEDIVKLIISNDLPNEPTFKAYIEAKVYDREGHLIQNRRQPMRSLTEWFLAVMAIPIIGTYSSSSSAQAPSLLVNVLGLPSQQSTYITGSNSPNNSANIVWNFSIQLGSGTQSFSPSLTSLAAPIANGTGAGELDYATSDVSYTATSITVAVTVINYSPSTITITEIGLIGNIYVQYQNSSNAYAYVNVNPLLSYDTFSPPISLPPGGLATFQITLTFTG
jgi:hypothetical protein